MKIEFLIATTNRKDLSFLDGMFQHTGMNGFDVLVINQCYEIPANQLEYSKGNVRCFSVAEKGLSKSRNLALKYAGGDICVIADDDVIYLPDTIETIKSTFAESDADINCFQIKTPDGVAYKKYASEVFRIKRPLQKMNVSSVEISFLRKSVLTNKCAFNEQMGLGAKYPGAEEIIFIHECIQKGLIANYVPIPFVMHPKESSSSDFTTDKVKSNGILFARLFPIVFILVDIYFTFKRYPRYKKNMSFANHLISLLKGNMLVLSNKV